MQRHCETIVPGRQACLSYLRHVTGCLLKNNSTFCIVFIQSLLIENSFNLLIATQFVMHMYEGLSQNFA